MTGTLPPPGRAAARPRYRVCRAARPPAPGGSGAEALWEGVPELTIAAFRPEGSRHQPRTRVQLLYDDRMLYGRFRVEDRYVRCRRTGFQAEVYKDSCVEFFVEPVPGRGYFNFEFNCGGALRAFFITDPTRVPGGFKAFTPLSAADGERVRRVASLPPVVDPEIAAPTLWHLEFGIPLAVLAAYAGPAASPAGATWRANFYKCGDETTHPHWGAWSPVDRLDFHRPPCFGELRFDADGGWHGCPGDRPRPDFPGEGPPGAGGSKEAR